MAFRAAVGAAVTGAVATWQCVLSEGEPRQARLWVLAIFDDTFQENVMSAQKLLAAGVAASAVSSAHISFAGPAPLPKTGKRVTKAEVLATRDDAVYRRQVEALRVCTEAFVSRHGLTALPVAFPGFGTFLQSNNSVDHNVLYLAPSVSLKLREAHAAFYKEVVSNSIMQAPEDRGTFKFNACNGYYLPDFAQPDPEKGAWTPHVTLGNYIKKNQFPLGAMIAAGWATDGSTWPLMGTIVGLSLYDADTKEHLWTVELPAAS